MRSALCRATTLFTRLSLESQRRVAANTHYTLSKSYKISRQRGMDVSTPPAGKLTGELAVEFPVVETTGLQLIMHRKLQASKGTLQFILLDDASVPLWMLRF